jgi:hypothetical protein
LGAQLAKHLDRLREYDIAEMLSIGYQPTFSALIVCA